MPFCVLRHDDHHFIAAYISRQWMRMRYLGRPQVFSAVRALLNKLNCLIARRIELCRRLSQMTQIVPSACLIPATASSWNGPEPS